MIFVDVGSHVGQTIGAVLERPEFTQIYAIEPMPWQLEVLRLRFGENPRVLIMPFALLDRDGFVDMYGSNAQLEASIYPTKRDVDPTVRTTVQCMRASTFFQGLPMGCVVNMNCEGGEVPVLRDLLQTGQICKIGALHVDFDIRKVPGFERDEQLLREALKVSGVRHLATWPEGETHEEQIGRWLDEL